VSSLPRRRGRCQRLTLTEGVRLTTPSVASPEDGGGFRREGAAVPLHGKLRHPELSRAWVYDVSEEAERDILFGLEQLGGREDRAERNALGLCQILNLGSRLVGEPRRQDRIELGDVLAPARTRVEFDIAEPPIADQRPRRMPLRHGVDDRHMSVETAHDLEFGVLAFAPRRHA